MLEPLAGLMLTKAQYLSLTSATAHREQLFPSWVEWNKLQMRATGEASRRGQLPEPWTINTEAFQAWCGRMGATPCIDELRIYCRTPGVRLPWFSPSTD